MKYFESALNCYMQHTWFTYKKLLWIKWIGITLYTVGMFSLLCWELASWPGYLNNGSFDSYNNWYETT